MLLQNYSKRQTQWLSQVNTISAKDFSQAIIKPDVIGLYLLHKTVEVFNVTHKA